MILLGFSCTNLWPWYPVLSYCSRQPGLTLKKKKKKQVLLNETDKVNTLYRSLEDTGIQYFSRS